MAEKGNFSRTTNTLMVQPHYQDSVWADFIHWHGVRDIRNYRLVAL